MAGKILVQFISDMERVFLFQMSINIGGDLNATVTHAPHSIIYQRHQRYILNPDFRRIADTIIDTAPGEFPGRGMPLGVEPSQQEMAAMPSAVDNWIKFTTSIGHFDQLILGAPFSLHGFPAPLLRVFAVYPIQTVMRFSRCGARFGDKKSPHNNLNLTTPSGMALVRVRYVAIRKSKTCSGSFGSRAGTLNKYVILNCWDRLPHKSSRVNVNLSGRGPSILLRKTVLSLKSPTGAFIAPLRCAKVNF